MYFIVLLCGPIWAHLNTNDQCHTAGQPFHCHGTGTVAYLPNYPKNPVWNTDDNTFDLLFEQDGWKTFGHNKKSLFVMNKTSSSTQTGVWYWCGQGVGGERTSKLEFRIHLDTTEELEPAIYDLPIHVASDDAEMKLISQRWFVYLDKKAIVLSISEDPFFESFGAHLNRTSLSSLFSGEKAFLYVQDEEFIFDLTGVGTAFERVQSQCEQR